MRSIQTPADHAGQESTRLRELHRYETLDTPPEPILDDLTSLAAHVCGTPVALISLVDEKRLWFKARHGVDAAELPRQGTLCSQAIWSDDLYIVGDTHRDESSRHHPTVVGPPHIRSYAAAPLRMPSGHVLGTLCVIDHHPRRLNARQRDALRGLGRQVVSQLELQRTVIDLQRAARARRLAEGALRASQERFQQFMNNGPAIAYIKDDEGRFVYVNEPLTRRFERPASEWIGKTDAEIFGRVDVSGVIEHDLQVLDTEQPLTVEETVPTPDGKTRHWQTYKFLLRDGDRKQVGGLSIDITARKLAEQERERLVSDLQQALAEVKTLAGFLPICASCKNIRTDEGYWQQIETYLGEHSELEFTHGICPVCLEKLYPEFAAHNRQQSSPPPQA